MSDEPAFPRLKRLDAEYGRFDRLDYVAVNEGGLTKREYAAIRAMQGLLADPSVDVPISNIAQTAVTAADALLAALKEET